MTHSGFNIGGAVLKSLIIGWLLIDLYMAPTIVAALRRHPHLLHVAVVNVLTGWTIVGWIVAIVMAASHVSEATTTEQTRSTGYTGPIYPWQEPAPPWPEQR